MGRPPDTEESRPRAASQSLHGGGNFKSTVGHAGDVDTSDAPAEPTAVQLRRRRAASWRLMPLTDGVRDPFDRLASPPDPSDFGLNWADLVTEVGRCRKAGWSDWELVVRFVDPRQVAA
jgi:hypothetical protein